MCEERGALCFIPPNNLLIDNAAMIAFLGEVMFKAKSNVFLPKQIDKIDIIPTERTDDIEVDWKN
jgi:tRNA A37 threonylcarbamoyltransferase TsaD